MKKWCLMVLLLSGLSTFGYAGNLVVSGSALSVDGANYSANAGSVGNSPYLVINGGTLMAINSYATLSGNNADPGFYGAGAYRPTAASFLVSGQNSVGFFHGLAFSNGQFASAIYADTFGQVRVLAGSVIQTGTLNGDPNASRYSHGVAAMSYSAGPLTVAVVDKGVSITTYGNESRGVISYENSLAVLGTGTNAAPLAIQTYGVNSSGIHAWEYGQISVQGDTQVTTYGETGYGAVVSVAAAMEVASGVNMTFNTSGNKAYGVFAQGSPFNDDGQSYFSNLGTLNVTTTGSQAYGVVSSKGANVELGTAQVTVSGSSSAGLYVSTGPTDSGYASTLSGTKVTVTAVGDSAYGVYATDTNNFGAKVDLQNSTIQATGGQTVGVGVKNAEVKLANSTVTSANQDAVQMVRGGTLSTVNTDISGKNNAISALQGANDIVVSVQGGRVSAVNGDAFNINSARVQANLSGGANVQGGSQGKLVNVQSGTFVATANNAVLGGEVTNNGNANNAITLHLQDTSWTNVGNSTLTNLDVSGSSLLGFQITDLNNFDTIRISGGGSLSIGDGVTIDVSALDASTLQIGDQFQLVSPPTSVGSVLWQTYGVQWDTSQFATHGIISLVAIPEPSTYALFLCGTLMMICAARFLQRRKER